MSDDETWMGESTEKHFPARPIRRQLTGPTEKADLAHAVALRVARRIYGRLGVVVGLDLYAYDLDTGCEVYRATVGRGGRRASEAMTGDVWVGVRRLCLPASHHPLRRGPPPPRCAHGDRAKHTWAPMGARVSAGLGLRAILRCARCGAIRSAPSEATGNLYIRNAGANYGG